MGCMNSRSSVQIDAEAIASIPITKEIPEETGKKDSEDKTDEIMLRLEV